MEHRRRSDAGHAPADLTAHVPVRRWGRQYASATLYIHNFRYVSFRYSKLDRTLDANSGMVN
ncbi:Uncharacterized protein ToN1_13790 [Aromatoleum petrolei]|nr:Uncharacterized protein ToN1_13790 [Aromatoleum petrolei]